RALARFKEIAEIKEITAIKMMDADTAPIKAALARLRRHQRQSLSAEPTGRVKSKDRPSRWRSNSSARASALAYLLCDSFSKHFRQILSRSRSTLKLIRLGGTGSLVRTLSTTSSTSTPENGGRPVSKA